MHLTKMPKHLRKCADALWRFGPGEVIGARIVDQDVQRPARSLQSQTTSASCLLMYEPIMGAPRLLFPNIVMLTSLHVCVCPAMLACRCNVCSPCDHTFIAH